jgi:hypothetical protein
MGKMPSELLTIELKLVGTEGLMGKCSSVSYLHSSNLDSPFTKLKSGANVIKKDLGVWRRLY